MRVCMRVYVCAGVWMYACVCVSRYFSGNGAQRYFLLLGNDAKDAREEKSSWRLATHGKRTWYVVFTS